MTWRKNLNYCECYSIQDYGPQTYSIKDQTKGEIELKCKLFRYANVLCSVLICLILSQFRILV